MQKMVLIASQSYVYYTIWGTIQNHAHKFRSSPSASHSETQKLENKKTDFVNFHIKKLKIPPLGVIDGL